MRKLGLFVLIITSISLTCGIPKKSSKETEEKINHFLKSLYEENSGVQKELPFEKISTKNIPGFSVAIINNGQIEWSKSFGFVENKSENKITPQTMFQAASLSKPYAAALALKVAKDLSLDLDKNINSYLKSWKIHENNFTKNHPVTLTNLLNHTSGLNVQGFRGYSINGKIPSLVQILSGSPPANSEALHVTFIPGSAGLYSGGGYCAIQQMLQDQTGMTFSELADSLIFKPLKLKNSTFKLIGENSTYSNIASGHYSNGKTMNGKWNQHPESAAAGLWTTAEDYAKFAIALSQKGALFSKDVQHHLFTPVSGPISLGLMIRGSGNNKWFTFNGGNVGYRCLVYNYIDQGKGCVVMTNSDSGFDGANKIIDAVAAIYQWPDFKRE